MQMTGLHWACLRNNLEILEVLVKYPDLKDSTDIFNRTPLHLACKSNNDNAVNLLLDHNVDPFIYSRGHKLAIDLTNNESIRMLLKHYSKIYK